MKDAIKLRDRRARKSQRCMIVDGVREIGRALDAGLRFREAFVGPPDALHQEAPELARRLSEAGVEVRAVTDAVFRKLAFGRRAEGIVAVVEIPRAGLADLPDAADPLVVVIEAIEKPGNVGAILRTADAAGASAVVLTEPVTDPYNPNVIRSSLGAVFTVPVCETTNRECLDWLRTRRIAILAARVDGAVPYTEPSYAGGVAIVLGSETNGLTADWEGPDVTTVSLPMNGVVDSLNVSATAAVLLYEALRKRTGGS